MAAADDTVWEGVSASPSRAVCPEMRSCPLGGSLWPRIEDPNTGTNEPDLNLNGLKTERQPWRCMEGKFLAIHIS